MKIVNTIINRNKTGKISAFEVSVDLHGDSCYFCMPDGDLAHLNEGYMGYFSGKVASAKARYLEAMDEIRKISNLPIEEYTFDKHHKMQQLTNDLALYRLDYIRSEAIYQAIQQNKEA
jgi:hypothetical protein